MLAGCGTSGSTPLGRSLPEEPAFLRPVIVPDPRAGEPAVVVAAREREGRVAANKIITGMRGWYRDLADRYARAKP